MQEYGAGHDDACELKDGAAVGLQFAEIAAQADGCAEGEDGVFSGLIAARHVADALPKRGEDAQEGEQQKEPGGFFQAAEKGIDQAGAEGGCEEGKQEGKEKLPGLGPAEEAVVKGGCLLILFACSFSIFYRKELAIDPCCERDEKEKEESAPEDIGGVEQGKELFGSVEHQADGVHVGGAAGIDAGEHGGRGGGPV